MFDTGRSWDSAGSRDPNEPITSQQEKNRFAIIRFAVVREIQILTVFSLSYGSFDPISKHRKNRARIHLFIYCINDQSLLYSFTVCGVL
jgi:hypothetical protein